jgi:hypothetical protein
MGLILALMLSVPADLDRLLRFSAPGRCERAEPLKTIVARMIVIDPQTSEGRAPGLIAVPGLRGLRTPRFGRAEIRPGSIHATVDLDLPGRWHGLRFARLRVTYVEGIDASTVQLRFAEPPGRVREVLNRAGFRLAPVGEWRTAGPGELLGLVPIEGGTAMSCVHG